MYFSNRTNIASDAYSGAVERRPFTSDEVESSVWNRLDSQENSEPDLRFKLLIRRTNDDFQDAEITPRKRMKLSDRFGQFNENSETDADPPLENIKFQVSNTNRNRGRVQTGISRPVQYVEVSEVPPWKFSSNGSAPFPRVGLQSSVSMYGSNSLTDSVYSSLSNEISKRNEPIGSTSPYNSGSINYRFENRPTSSRPYSSLPAVNYPVTPSFSSQTYGLSSGLGPSTYSETAWSSRPSFTGRFSSSWNNNNVVIPRLSSNTLQSRVGQKVMPKQMHARTIGSVPRPFVKPTLSRPAQGSMQSTVKPTLSRPAQGSMQSNQPGVKTAQSVTRPSAVGQGINRSRIMPPVKKAGASMVRTKIMPPDNKAKVTTVQTKVTPANKVGSKQNKVRPRILPPNGTTSTMVPTKKTVETEKPGVPTKTFRAIVLITGAIPLVRKDESIIKNRLRKDSADTMFSDGDPLVLISMELVYGRLVVECANVGTFNWIINWSMQHRGEKVLAVNPILAGDPLKIGVEVTPEQRGPGIHTITKEINRANPGMFPEHWRLINEIVDQDGIQIQFSVQPCIIERIRRLDWKLKFQDGFVKVIDYRTKVQKTFYMKAKI